MLVGLLLIVIGLTLSYFGWRASTRIEDIEDQIEWEDAVYGSGGGEVGWYGIAFGALSIFIGIIMLLTGFF